MEVPELAYLRDQLELLVERDADARTTALTGFARDGTAAEIIWEEDLHAVQVVVRRGEETLLHANRETVTKVSANRSGTVTHLQVSSRSEGIIGELVVQIGDGVSVEDRILQG